MYHLRYTGEYSADHWVVDTYLEVVHVEKGECKVKFKETVEALLRQGFELVSEESNKEKESEEQKVPTLKPNVELSEKEKRALEMLKQGVSINSVSRNFRIPKKKLEKMMKDLNIEGD